MGMLKGRIATEMSAISSVDPKEVARSPVEFILPSAFCFSQLLGMEICMQKMNPTKLCVLARRK